MHTIEDRGTERTDPIARAVRVRWASFLPFWGRHRAATLRRARGAASVERSEERKASGAVGTTPGAESRRVREWTYTQCRSVQEV
jgi:hypothetical protein